MPTRNQDLGCSVSRKEFVEHEFESRASSHAELLEKILRVRDLQCAWLILLYCGVSRANNFIRAVSPDDSLQFAQRHEEQIWYCFTTLIGIAPESVPESARSVAMPATLSRVASNTECKNSNWLARTTTCLPVLQLWREEKNPALASPASCSENNMMQLPFLNRTRDP